MRRLLETGALALAILVLSAGWVGAETWKIDPHHSTASFKIRHLFSKVSGEFRDWQGTIEFDPSDIAKTQAHVSIVAGSIDTNNDQRDEHLRSSDFFDVEEYPTIEFTSTKVFEKDGQWTMEGDLTMHGVTKPVSLDFSFEGAGPDPWGGQRAGFSATTELDRKEFGIEWNKALDQGGMVLGDTVDIDIEIEAAAATDSR